jgi:hypothetical protein
LSKLKLPEKLMHGSVWFFCESLCICPPNPCSNLFSPTLVYWTVCSFYVARLICCGRDGGVHFSTQEWRCGGKTAGICTESHKK